VTTTTTDQGLILAASSDNDNVPQSMADYNGTSGGGTGVESRLVKRYTSTADRTTRNTSPATGELSFRTDISGYEYWAGSAWVPWPERYSAVKSANTARSSTTTRTADPHLTLTLRANVSYTLSGLLILSSAANAAGDLNMDFSFPANAVVHWGGVGPNNTITSGSFIGGEFQAQSNQTTSPTGATPYGATTVPNTVLLSGYVAVGATAGSLTLQWAQQTSNANATTLLIGSWLRLDRI
jgi:hypothetical protein